MENKTEYADHAKLRFEEAMARVRETQPPRGQKFMPHTYVRIAKDLGRSMSHFPSDCFACVEYTYAHAFGGNDVCSYSLIVNTNAGQWHTIAWYHEYQLSEVEDADLIDILKKDMKKNYTNKS